MITEMQIEREAERMMDALDKRFLNSDMTQKEYELQVEEINYWAKLRYREIRK